MQLLFQRVSGLLLGLLTCSPLASAADIDGTESSDDRTDDDQESAEELLSSAEETFHAAMLGDRLAATALVHEVYAHWRRLDSAAAPPADDSAATLSLIHI